MSTLSLLVATVTQLTGARDLIVASPWPSVVSESDNEQENWSRDVLDVATAAAGFGKRAEPAADLARPLRRPPVCDGGPVPVPRPCLIRPNHTHQCLPATGDDHRAIDNCACLPVCVMICDDEAAVTRQATPSPRPLQ